MKKYITYVASFFVLSIPAVAFAQITNPLKNASSIPQIISSLLGYVVKIGGIVAIFAFIYTGYLFVKAQGSPAELENAKKAFFNTCIGVAILLGAQIIASIIVGTISAIGNGK